MNLGTIIGGAVKRFSGRPALIDDARRYTFAQMGDRIDRLGTALCDLGLDKGARIASLQRNSIEAIEFDVMAARFGYCRTLLNARSTAEDHEYVLSHSGATALVFGAEFIEHLGSIRDRLRGVSTFICVGEGAPAWALSYNDLLCNASAAHPPWSVDEGDLHSIYYTSGSTGQPKGVMLSQHNWLVHVRNHLLDPYSHASETDVLLHAAPLSHASGCLVLPHLVRGAAQRVIEKFDVEKTFDLIENERVTTMFLAPTMINMMLEADKAGRRDMTSLHTVIYGGAPMAVERIRETYQHWGAVLMQGYGQWEAPQQSTLLTRADHVEAVQNPDRVHRLASCGRPLTFVEVAIMDDAGELLPPDTEGEIVVAGDHLMLGYLDNPEATAKVRVGRWLRTGDIGKVDDAGFVYITDRKHDVIITGGSNVYPREIEEVLYTHPDIGEAVAIGIPDDVWGETVHVVASARSGRSVDEDEFLAWCKDRFSNDKRPRSISVVDVLPKSAYGKILRRDIRAPYWAGKDRRI
ncbi:MAG: AMP-binding protein [Burkholderiaceae bacterium]